MGISRQSHVALWFKAGHGRHYHQEDGPQEPRKRAREPEPEFDPNERYLSSFPDEDWGYRE